MRDRLFGAGKELTQEDMQSDKYKEFQTQRQDMIAKTREKILSIFGAEQREKVEKFLAAPRGPGGRMRTPSIATGRGSRAWRSRARRSTGRPRRSWPDSSATRMAG